MLNDRYVFSELMDFVPKHDFDRCVGCDRASAIDYAAFLGFFCAEPS